MRKPSMRELFLAFLRLGLTAFGGPAMVAQVVGFIKGKSAIHIARTYSGHKKNFTGQSFWARGYAVHIIQASGFAGGTYRLLVHKNE